MTLAARLLLAFGFVAVFATALVGVPMRAASHEIIEDDFHQRILAATQGVGDQLRWEADALNERLKRLCDHDTLFDKAHLALERVKGDTKALDPEFWIGHMMRAQAYERLGQYDRAVEGATIAARFSGQNSKTLSLRGYVLAKAGRADEAREVLNALRTATQQRYVPPYALALIHAGLGETDAAFEWLDRAYAAHDVHLMFLTVDPKWDSVRSDERFKRLLRRCRFPV